MRLTKTAIEKLEPGERDQFVWDADLPGFGVKVTPTGSRIYLVQYRPKGQNAVTRRYTIGRHGAPWKTEAARNAAEQLLARVRLGEDPFAVEREKRRQEAAAVAAEKARKKQEQRERFELVVADFVERYAKPKNRSWKETERILTSDDLRPWRSRAVSSITKRDIVDLVNAVTPRSPSAARLLFAHLRKLFGWCVEQLHLEQTPFSGLKAPRAARPRDRVLNDHEVALLWRAAEKVRFPYGRLVRLLLLTAQRLDEVTKMRWSELDLEKREWVIPGARTKNGQAHTVDLSEQAIAELRRVKTETEKRRGRRPSPEDAKPLDLDVVFTINDRAAVGTPGAAKREYDEALVAFRLAADPLLNATQASLQPWRFHDLRRTAATGMARLGFAPHIVEAVLNHRSGVRGGLVAVYQHYDHRPERKAALEAWGAHVAQITATPPKTPKTRARGALEPSV